MEIFVIQEKQDGEVHLQLLHFCLDLLKKIQNGLIWILQGLLWRNQQNHQFVQIKQDLELLCCLILSKIRNELFQFFKINIIQF
jgi:hypothetical protein